VDAVDERLARLFQRFGRGDIRLDHHLFDQPHRFQPVAIGDGFDLAVFADGNAPFRQIEIERLAPVAGDRERLVRGPQWRQRTLVDFAMRGIRFAVEGALRLRIGEAGRRPHRRAQEFVASFVALRVDDQAHGKARPVFILAQ
jgi:hypothetical protein